MSSEKLHDLLAQLKEQHSGADLVEGEYQNRLEEIIVSLEQQALYPDTFDQHSSLNDQVKSLLLDYEAEHPTIKAVLDGIQQVLSNFRA